MKYTIHIRICTYMRMNTSLNYFQNRKIILHYVHVFNLYSLHDHVKSNFFKIFIENIINVEKGKILCSNAFHYM